MLRDKSKTMKYPLAKRHVTDTKTLLLRIECNKFIDKTEKPIVGVFLKETPIGAPFQAGTYTIYARGKEAVVQRKCVYPIGECHAH